MLSFNLLSLFAVLSIVYVAFAAPVSDSRPSSPGFDPTRTFQHGEYVGVRPTAYEKKHPSHKKISIHPGIIVGGPDPITGKHDVAMISKKPPFDPPQAPIEHFQTGTGIYGNVVLKARPVSPGAMKPWVDTTTNAQQARLVGHGYNKLKTAMEPHVNWEPPKFPYKKPKAPKKPKHVQPGSVHSSHPGTTYHPTGSNIKPGSSHASHPGSSSHPSGSKIKPGSSHASHPGSSSYRPGSNQHPVAGHPSNHHPGSSSHRPASNQHPVAAHPSSHQHPGVNTHNSRRPPSPKLNQPAHGARPPVKAGGSHHPSANKRPSSPIGGSHKRKLSPSRSATSSNHRAPSGHGGSTSKKHASHGKHT